MTEEVKKISFGFSKLVKPKTSIIGNNKNVKSVDNDSVQFIDCVEDKSIKVKNEAPKKSDLLVIPLPKQNVVNTKRRELLQKILTNAGDSENIDSKSDSVSVNNVSPIIENIKVETLDEVAAREIIEDLKKVNTTEEDKQNFTVPLTDEALLGGKESSLDDYDSIPVDKFGMAMLRGMGWAPGKGIGKTEQVVSTKQPVLRPKGLGLGADNVIKADLKTTVSEPLKLIKGSFVRIIAGVHKDLFGEVIGFDDETGRLIVKMALGNNVLTFNEFMVEVISKEDFNKNSKVINVKKYEEYKMKENSQGVVIKENVGKQINDDCHKQTYKTKHKSNRSSSESSTASSEGKNVKIENNSRRRDDSLSPQESRKEYDSKTRANYRSPPEKPSERYNFKHEYSYESSKKEKIVESDFAGHKKPQKYYSYTSRKEYSTNKTYRSSSEESSNPQKYVSRKETKKRSKSSSSCESSSPERHSYSKEKESKVRSRKHSSSSDYGSDENSRRKHASRTDYKKKCKKNKEKKKSRRRSRSHSSEKRQKDKSSRKHKKSKY